MVVVTVVVVVVIIVVVVGGAKSSVTRVGITSAPAIPSPQTKNHYKNNISICSKNNDSGHNMDKNGNRNQR